MTIPGTSDSESDWIELVQELRTVREAFSQDWAGLDDHRRLAQHVCGESPSDEAGDVEAILKSHPIAAEAAQTLRELLATPGLIDAANVRLRTSGLSTLRPVLDRWKRTHPTLLKLVGVEDSLLEAVSQAALAAPEERADEYGLAIHSGDRLYAIAAGGSDQPSETSPMWFTRLREPPRQLRWTGHEANEEWQVRLQADGQAAVVLGITTQPEMTVPDDIRQQLPPGVPIQWTCSPTGSGETVVHSAFEVLTADQVRQVDESLRLREGVDERWEQTLARVGVCLGWELFDESRERLARLNSDRLVGFPRFFVDRAYAALYRLVGRRLSGPPLWMGDPAGVWAAALARKYLRSAWSAVGVDYED